MWSSEPFSLIQVPAVANNNVLLDTIFAYSGSAYGTSNDFGATGLNIGSGSNGTTNRALLLAVCLYVGNAPNDATNPVVTWDSAGTPQDVPIISGPHYYGVCGNLYFMGLTAPHIGQLNLTGSWTGSSRMQIYALSVVNADQAGGIVTFHADVSNSGDTNVPAPSVTVSGATAGEMCMAGFMSIDVPTFANDGTPNNIGSRNEQWDGTAASYSNAGESTTLTHPMSQSFHWVAAGIAIKAA